MELTELEEEACFKVYEAIADDINTLIKRRLEGMSIEEQDKVSLYLQSYYRF